MYNPIDVQKRIKEIADGKEIAYSAMWEALEMGQNTMQNLKTSMPKSNTLAKIADYLDCSVDYLLGRTDDPQAHKRRKLGKMVIDLDAIAVPLIQPVNPLDVEELA